MLVALHVEKPRAQRVFCEWQGASLKEATWRKVRKQITLEQLHQACKHVLHRLLLRDSLQHCQEGLNMSGSSLLWCLRMVSDCQF